jgi:Fe-S-cluster containining protein
LSTSSSNSSSGTLRSKTTRPPEKKKKQAWFDNDKTGDCVGISFQCTACGKCCTGASGGKVWVNEAEQDAIAQLLNLKNRQDLQDQYLVQDTINTTISSSSSSSSTNNKWGIQMIPHDTSNTLNTQEEKCIFLTSENKCSIYRARPTQCQTFPFWPALVASEHDWETTARSQCEGITISTNYATTTTTQVPSTDIWRNLIVHSVHRWSMQEEDDKDEQKEEQEVPSVDASLTYDQMIEALQVLDSEDLRNDFRDEFVTNYARDVLYQDEEMLVLETTGTGLGRPSRSLIFKNSPTYSQSEIGLLLVQGDDDDDDDDDESESENDDDTFQILDHSTLLLDVHQVMSQAADMILLEEEAEETASIVRCHAHVAVLGTGAGALPMYLHQKFPHAHLDCVEASSKVLELAQTYFGLVKSPRLRLLCQLGETYTSAHPLDLILVDVASCSEYGDDDEDSSSPPQQVPPVLQVPPSSFLRDDFLERAYSQLAPQGLLVWNVVASSENQLEENVLHKLRHYFDHLRVVKLQRSRNWVVVCSKIPREWKNLA